MLSGPLLGGTALDEVGEPAQHLAGLRDDTQPQRDDVREPLVHEQLHLDVHSRRRRCEVANVAEQDLVGADLEVESLELPAVPRGG